MSAGFPRGSGAGLLAMRMFQCPRDRTIISWTVRRACRTRARAATRGRAWRIASARQPCRCADAGSSAFARLPLNEAINL